MAQISRRVDSYRNRRYYKFEEGGAVRRLDELTHDQRQTKRRRKQSAITAEEKLRSHSLSRGYVVFLALICVAVSVLCVMYLKQKATLTTQYESIAQLESDYNQIKGDNDAKYNQVLDSVSLETVKSAALGRLKMHYAKSDQIVYYDLTEDSYVRQYKDVPTE